MGTSPYFSAISTITSCGAIAASDISSFRVISVKSGFPLMLLLHLKFAEVKSFRYLRACRQLHTGYIQPRLARSRNSVINRC